MAMFNSYFDITRGLTQQLARFMESVIETSLDSTSQKQVVEERIASGKI
jgi:hypothetical protein